MYSPTPIVQTLIRMNIHVGCGKYRDRVSKYICFPVNLNRRLSSIIITYVSLKMNERKICYIIHKCYFS